MTTRVLIILLLLLNSRTAWAQYTLGQPLDAAWEPASNENTAAVTSYEYQFDTDTVWTQTNVTIPQATYLFRLPQARLTVGSHVLRVRACAGTFCTLAGTEASITFTIARPVPLPPRNLTIRPGTPIATLTIPQAVQVLQSYAFLTMDRYITDAEIGFVASFHPNVPPTKWSVLDAADAAYRNLVPQD